MKRKPETGKSRSAARYKVYTRPELYDEQRPMATWAVRLGIVLSMLGMVAVFRQPLHAAITSVFGA